MPFEIQNTEIEDVKLIKIKKFDDERGFFEELYRNNVFHELGIKNNFNQVNLSYSKKNVFRGFHFQRNPKPQGKLVTVISGRIIDYAIDLRRRSVYYKKHVCYELENGRMLFIPEGFAHGFLALEDSYVLYLATNEFDIKLDSGVIYNDDELNIKLPDNITISEKDRSLKKLNELDIDF
ncbi:dTDP-4-dehydrorhamnose 3,5-epimerase [Picrophilus oshimae]|uniref:dTDP-4-dehydrorhamnose 3,5-epimerase n=1 Tax=Picrophilus torridus (strain ATCC 700027 / DSM 9790 / JCM 10055 / NBRC 100828 / KAW 2/3) TaxID=1122961 RepID=A0A8G2FWK5_PICTO|nr:dTDP-4-dehydrorhamnose 3,5-epimerase [Picrophilus oshimae]SMD30789.1 dTDP-4-dehydrorhamnose 3,5-epimerase [Picrophilus oshimae DSM 9789]